MFFLETIRWVFVWILFLLGRAVLSIRFLASALISLFMLASLLVLSIFSSILWVPGIRRSLISRPALQFFRKHMPSMGDTEKIAIEAGDVWWDAELFSGRPNWQRLLAMPLPTLTSAEQSFLDCEVEELCAKTNDWQITQSHDLPVETWQALKEKRFFGLSAEKSEGGLNFSAFAHSTIVMKLASRSPTLAVTAMVPNSLGPAELLRHYGTEAQKSYYLPRLARGEEIPCFALTGPFAGSDAASMRDTGVVCFGEYEGKKTLGIRLSWEKHYITLAPVATLLGLAFHLTDPDHLLGEKEEVGITLALLPANYPGVIIGRRHYPMCLSFMNGPTEGREVFIPLSFVIGGEAQVGQGWRMLMECLSTGRSISLPSIAVSSGKQLYRLTGAYARIREQFNVSIAAFEGVQEALARIAGFTYLMEAARQLTCSAIDHQHRPAIISAIMKYHTTEMYRTLTNDSMDIHGGRGIQAGPNNYLLPAYFSIPIAITVEGANILTRNLMIFGQGVVRCHPYLRQEIAAVQMTDVKAGLKQFDRAIFSHLSYFFKNAVRAFYYGVTGGRFVKSPKRGAHARFYRAITRMSTALALCSDVALFTLGGQLKRKESLSARLGDVLSHLYLASAVLRYREDHATKEDEQSTQWACEYCLFRIQEALDGFFENFPVRWIGKITRKLIFPFSDRYHKPSDALSEKLVKPMLSPNAFRDRLTASVYTNQQREDLVGRMELALLQVTKAESAYGILKSAIKSGRVAKSLSRQQQIAEIAARGWLSPAEKADILLAEEMISQVVRVDDFALKNFLGETHG